MSSICTTLSMSDTTCSSTRAAPRHVDWCGASCWRPLAAYQLGRWLHGSPTGKRLTPPRRKRHSTVKLRLPAANRRFTQMTGGAATAAAHQSHWRLSAAYQPRPLACMAPPPMAFVTMHDKVVISLHCAKCVRPDVLDYPDHASAHGLVRGISLEAVSRLAAKATGCMAPPLAFDSDETKTTCASLVHAMCLTPISLELAS